MQSGISTNNYRIQRLQAVSSSYRSGKVEVQRATQNAVLDPLIMICRHQQSLVSACKRDVGWCYVPATMPARQDYFHTTLNQSKSVHGLVTADEFTRSQIIPLHSRSDGRWDLRLAGTSTVFVVNRLYHEEQAVG